MKFPRVLSLLVVVLCAAALIGWVVDISIPICVLHGLVTLKADAAIGMVLVGSQLALLLRITIDAPLRVFIAALTVAIITLGAVGFVLLGIGLLLLSKSVAELTWTPSRSSSDGFIVSIAVMVTAAEFSGLHLPTVRCSRLGPPPPSVFKACLRSHCH